MEVEMKYNINKPKYLVRPHDFSIFDLDETNGCYRVMHDGSRPNAMTHFTYENLTENYGFFPIDETEIEIYREKFNEYYNFLSWQHRPDGHGGVKGGTYEEYLKSKKRYGKESESIKDESNLKNSNMKESLKIYRCEFQGVWGVGNCLILAAYNQEQAEEMAHKTIKHSTMIVVNELTLNEPQIIEYLSGDY